MSSDSRFPQTPDRAAEQEKAPASEPASPVARVLEFPSEEVSSPGRPVPAGVWNTPSEMDAAESTERPVRRARREGEVGQLVEFPRQPVTQKRRRSEAPPPRGDEPTGQQRAPTTIAPPAGDLEPERPRYLASELLKTNWFPRETLTPVARWSAVAAGAIGAIAMLVLGGVGGAALVLFGVLLACAIVGAVPMPARVRGIGLAAFGVAGVALVAWLQAGHDASGGGPLLAVCTTLTAGALFFRAAHRTSQLARVLVGVGLASLTLWGIVTGGVEALIVESLDWQAWVWPALRVLLGVLVLSSLLSFLDPMGDGGAWVAGIAILAWLALYTAGSAMLALWPVRGPGIADLGAAEWLATIALPLVAGIAALGMCQVLALVSRPSKSRRELTRATIG